MSSRLILLIVALYLLPLPLQAGTTFNSGNKKVPLLELYTSEGCSSCPAADAWLSRLVKHPKLWQQMIPVAFHVDYWNHLGWLDPFANSQNSQRQYRYKHNGNINAVYTPAFVYNGKETRSWFHRSSLLPVSESAHNLKVTLNGRRVSATFDNDKRPYEPLLLNIAVLGFDLKTHVASGENKDKTLSHNFVVLAHKKKLSTNNRWRTSLPKVNVDSPRTALAAWVSHPYTPVPLQATGGWLP
ncbi:hypothetical protein that often co-occurs with aconitase [gamma proteobacterium IMCC2047]|nr:hypothetical protein that often co-occurs with aconitase [gamma proteobacterium IMCC2047]